MQEIAREYLIPNGTRVGDIEDSLRVRSRLVEDATHEIRRRFLDSFDWSLYLAGAAVEERIQAGGRRLLWHDLRTDATPCEQGIETAPGFARDLPAGPVRQRLEPVLGVRRLLPLLEVLGSVKTLRLLNDDDKTVVRLRLEENRYRDPTGAREGSLGGRLRLLAVKGYDADLEKAARILSRDLGLEPAATGLLLEALAAVGRRPGDYSSKLDYRLDPDKRADATTKEILLGLLDTLEANIEGTKANLDTEFLHDLRVATRRTRSALTQIKRVFPRDLVDDYKERFAWLQQVTGPVRDLDVYLLDFDGYQASLPAPLRPHLEPLREYLTGHYAKTRQTLVAALESPRFRDLCASWRGFLTAPVPERTAIPNAMRPIKAVADERIWRMYRRVCKEGRGITAESPSAQMHELRKSCKKLRYLMEFFASLYPSDEVDPLIKHLKVLLDNLGRFQDLAVQAGRLREIAQRMRDAGSAETDTLLGMGVLVGNLFYGQDKARLAFERIFADFDSRDRRAVFQDLFAPKRIGGGPD